MELTLVNLSPSAMREVVVGAGSFGEHCFGRVRAGEEELEVGDTFFQVRLQPASEIEIKIDMERYCKRPGYCFPWHGGEIPFR